MSKKIKLGLDIERINRIISRNMDAMIMRAVGDKISISQAYVIDFIYMKKGCDVFQKDLEKEFSLKRSSVSLMLNNMEKNGLINRIAVESDARLRKIVLTEKALALNNIISEQIDYTENKLTEDLTDEEIEVFQRVISKMANSLEEK